MFIHEESGTYPHSAIDIIAAHPQCSFPVPFAAPDGYAKVHPTTPPALNAGTHHLDEIAPVLEGGQWQQQWAVRVLTEQELQAREQAAADKFVRDRAHALDVVNAEYERRTAAISASYPAAERESWHVQTGEARTLLADPEAATPWIDAAASARGLDREELAQRIRDKDDAYRVVHGTLSGQRQLFEDQILASETPLALAAVDVSAWFGLPPAWEGA